VAFTVPPQIIIDDLVTHQCPLSLRFATIASDVPTSRLLKSDDWRTRADLTPQASSTTTVGRGHLAPVAVLIERAPVSQTLMDGVGAVKSFPLVLYCTTIGRSEHCGGGQVESSQVKAGNRGTVWILDVPITAVSESAAVVLAVVSVPFYSNPFGSKAFRICAGGRACRVYCH
jgi:hypothetical protein